MLKDLLKKIIADNNNRQAQTVYSGEPERQPAGSGSQTAKSGKKIISSLATTVVILFLAVLILSKTIYTVGEGEYAYVTQFGKIVRIVEDPGIHFLTPFLQDYNKLDRRLLVYDVSPSEVLTADKKAMIVDSYALWRIADVQKFIRSVGAIPECEKRLDATCYSVIKNVMGELQQSQLISDEESSRDSLNNRVSEMVKANMESYGVDVSRVEIRRYDLPQDNLAAVYVRMISERSQMAAQFKAEGLYEAAKIKNQSDKEYEVILAKAQADAERILGEAEGNYIKIMGEVYGDKGRSELYKLMLDLNNLEKSLSDNPTIILSKDSYLGDILNNESFKNEP